MNDRWAVVLAGATAAGALAGRPVPVLAGLLLVLLALAARRPALLCIAAALLASGLAARSWGGLRPPPASSFSGRVVLVGDPEDVRGAVRVDVRAGHRRVEAWARGAPAGALLSRLAGEQVAVAGRLQAVPPRVRARLAARHIAARLSVARVGRWSPGTGVSRLANGIRRTLVAGAASIPDAQRPLFTGFVLGDDRGQRPETVDDFRGSGLTHLLAVSGENVAFVLALASPLLARLRLGWRFAAGLAVLALFGVVTRWEPSVLRAEAMAALSLLAALTGRPQSGLRLLALAVAGLLLVDPLLVRSVGFLLSVGASAGIVLLAPAIARRLPGPRPIATALAVTLAAQAGVAPVLVPVFGGLPLASLPANLLAAPAAGPVMVWGLAAGVPAGLVGGRVAALVHLPTRALVGWIEGVARVGAALPLGVVRGGQLLAVVVLVIGVGLALRRPRLAAAATVAVWSLPALAPGQPRVPGARLWRAGGVTVLAVDTADAVDLLAGLRAARVRRLDVVILRRSGRAGDEAAAALLRRHPARLVLDRRRVGDGRRVVAGRLEVTVSPDGAALEVDVRRLRT